MSFKKTFEKRLNRNMQQDSEVGESSSSKIDDMDIKTQPGPADDADDYDLNVKKDAPPRFSTLFGPAPPIVQSVPTPSPRREYFPPPQRKSGIWMPWSLFIILAVMLFLESTVLFTYTVIGLYNNTPSRLLALAGQGIGGSMPYGMCEPLKATSPQPAAVNFAPNFVMPQAAPASSITVTVTLTTTASATTPTTSTSITTSTTSASPTTSSKSDAGVLTVTAPVHVVTETQTVGPTTTGTPTLTTSTATGTTTTPNSGTVQAGVFLPPIVLGTTSTAKADATTFLPPIAATTSSA